MTNQNRRRFLRTLAGTSSAAVLAACGAPSGAQQQRSLDDCVAALTERLRPRQPYRAATEPEAQQAITAVGRLIDGDVGAAGGDFGKLGFSVGRVHDAPSQRDFVLASAEADTDRAWGMLVIEPGGGAPEVLIEVPHPRADLDTEQIGLALLRAVPGSALLVAGAHRRAARGAADVAHQPDSLFAAVANELAERGSYQLQLHGFADDSLRGEDVVISTGAAEVDRTSKRLAEALDDADLRVCRAWSKKCRELEGKQNVQGNAAARRGLPFLHLELNNTTRTDLTKRSAVVAALAGVLVDIA